MYYKCLTFDKTNKKLLNAILNETSAIQIKKYGRQVKNYDEKIWNDLRYQIMVNALHLKFSQNNIIKEKLLETKNKILYEASKNDKIWGIGYSVQDAILLNKNTYGQNLLGKALMEVRDKLLIEIINK
jgi:ribA/ribD-fused uncharacterized protein